VGCAPFTPTEVSLFEKGRPAPTLIKAGVEGAQSPPKGSGGCAPKNFKIGGELSTLPTPPRVGPNTLANPEPTRVGKRGVQGGTAPLAGVWGVSPTKPKLGASCPHYQPRHEWDPIRRQTLSPRGWANGGVQGAPPPGRGSGGCAPKNQKRGELPTLATPPRVGPNTPANQKPTRVGKTGGPGGHSPLAEGLGGVPPRNLKRGERSTPTNLPRVGPKALANP